MIPFNKTHIAGKELYYIAEAVLRGDLKGDGPFTKQCHDFLQKTFDVKRALLTHSCTAALEMAALLTDIREGDEVIMPSFTFSSTANAFLMRGAKIIFCDIRPDTLNIDEAQIEQHITPRTKAIVPVHYAGVGCEMKRILEIARQYQLSVIEDAAHAINARYNGQWLGTFGDMGTFSFHETKNYSSGEGGALLVNNPEYIERAEIIREKGTNRSQFFRGEVDKYSWVDIGSSYLPSEIIAAFLRGQLDHLEEINQERLHIWQSYYQALESLENLEIVRRPVIPAGCEHNAHMFYCLLPDNETREQFINYCRSQGVYAVFHYVPLHTSPMGKKLGYSQGDLPITEEWSQRIVRLPLYCGLAQSDIDKVCEVVSGFSPENRIAPSVANF